MKQIVAIVVIIVLFIGVALGGFIYYKNSRFSPSSNLPAVTSENKTINEKDGNFRFSIDADYPVFKTSNQALQDNLNKETMNLIQNLISTYKVNAQNNDMSKLPKDLTGLLMIRYNQMRADEAIVSMEYHIQDSVAGMAHPNNYTDTFNYSGKEMRLLQISDLFKPGSNFVQVLSDISIKNLNNQNSNGQFSDSDWIKKGAGADPKNFEKFLIMKDSMDIVFDTYQVGPGSAGVKKVNIKYSQLKDILNSQIL